LKANIKSFKAGLDNDKELCETNMEKTNPKEQSSGTPKIPDHPYRTKTEGQVIYVAF